MPGGGAAAAQEQVLAYYQNDGGASSAALQTRHASFNQLAFDTYTVTAQGVVSGRTFSQDLAAAQGYGIASFATVSNFGRRDFSPAIGHAVVTSARHTQNFIAGMLRKLALGHYQGINLDFEGVPAKDRRAFTTFVGKVSARMHSAGYKVVISVPAAASDDPTDSWTGVFDLASLGALVDVVQLMTYDEHGPWGDPGPVAGLDWVTAAVQYVVSVVPSTKVSLGIPAYAYDWNITNPKANDTIAWNDLASVLTQNHASLSWDTPSSSPWFSYVNGGDYHVVWCENSASLGAKAALVSQYGLAGISVWALGNEDASFWQAVEPGH